MVRTRFAPSPTGFLHVGSARTALFCWLYARKLKGKFILRIEDTDRERSTQEAIDAILDAMKWLGLDWDEGPFYQMKHLQRYKEVADKLIADGKAYYCYCSKERLEKLRSAQIEKKEKPRYDGHCRSLHHPPNKDAVIRFRNPDVGTVEITDAVHGEVHIDNAELDDLVLIRSDGVPTYNFSVVVDDWDMKVTHVIRGDDHLANTPRQINILRALGATPPKYAHLPMILGSDGKRLSKRHGAVSVQYYRDEGILPEALLNYLVRLGWSHGDQEIFSREEMTQFFDIEHINKAHAAFNVEKLHWLNQHYIKTADPAALIAPLKDVFLRLHNLDIDKCQGPDLIEVIRLQQERSKTLCEMAEKSIFFYKDVDRVDDIDKKNLTKEALDALKVLQERLSKIDWKAELIHETLTKTADDLGLKLGKLAQPLRVAVTGGLISPPIDHTLVLIGKDRSLARLDKVLK